MPDQLKCYVCKGDLDMPFPVEFKDGCVIHLELICTKCFRNQATIKDYCP